MQLLLHCMQHVLLHMLLLLAAMGRQPRVGSHPPAAEAAALAAHSHILQHTPWQLDLIFVRGSSDSGAPADAQSAPDAAYYLLLAVVVAVGVFDGICQGAVFGEAATMPSEYTHVSARAPAV